MQQINLNESVNRYNSSISDIYQYFGLHYRQHLTEIVDSRHLSWQICSDKPAIILDNDVINIIPNTIIHYGKDFTGIFVKDIDDNLEYFTILTNTKQII